MTTQLNMFETKEETVLAAVTNLKCQLDAMGRKIFCEIKEQQRDIEFLSLQLQILMEKKDKIQ